MAKRDPRTNPQPGDELYTVSATGKHSISRKVVARVNNDIFYVMEGGKRKKTWLGSWLEWARDAEVA